MSTGASDQKLVLYKPMKFHLPEVSDVVIEFVEEDGQISMWQNTPVFVSRKK